MIQIDDDECSVCGGAGEIDARSALLPDGAQLGCPACIAREKDETIARLHQIIADAAEAIERGSTTTPVVEILRSVLPSRVRPVGGA